jgi:hypothetical protein
MFMATDFPGAEDRLLTSREADDICGFASGYFAKLRVKGSSLPFVKFGARAVRYRLSDIRAFLEANTRRSTSDRGTEQ